MSEIRWKPTPFTKELWEQVLLAGIEAAEQLMNARKQDLAFRYLVSALRDQTYELRHGYVYECNLDQCLVEGPAFDAGAGREFKGVRAYAYYNAEHLPIVAIGVVICHNGHRHMTAPGDLGDALDSVIKEALAELHLPNHVTVNEVIAQIHENDIEEAVQKFSAALDEFEEKAKGSNKWLD